ncbi:acyl-CoA dehydrogenase family protein [Nocardia jiangxiensis]|uniref:Acyl-CoA dehydrogenase family protein n=1 Tax=Nocardia jiangxiensis TaxID=282685 RepID=A0ABW6RRE2_9NOCA|nr:acyl-CoA dehydrogenase family protein [Nocardia jiangxiensis]
MSLATELRDLVDDLLGDRIHHTAAGGPGTPRGTRPGRRAAANQHALWARLRELGLTRVGIDEDRGGSGGTFDDLLIIVNALAAHGISQPIVESATADWVLGHSGRLGERFSTLLVLDEPLNYVGGPITARAACRTVGPRRRAARSLYSRHGTVRGPASSFGHDPPR